MCDLVFYSLEAWDDVWRRNQFVVDLLVRRNPELRVLFVAPASTPGKRGTRLNGVAGPLAAPRPLPTHDRVFLAQPLKLPFDSRPAVRRVNDALQSFALARWTKRLGMRDPMLWINDHARSRLARRDVPVVYDITDDWIAAAPEGRERDRIAAHDATLCGLADATIVCSPRLAEIKRLLVRSPSRLHLVPNGVHVDHYASVRDRSLPLPEPLARLERPIFGYTGTLHAERIDVPLVEVTARRLDRGSLVFVGPDHLDGDSSRRLAATGRVHFLPAVPYAQIPQYMRAMDVMMVPHRTSEFVESLNPIKLWEYLAAGLPIVATPVAGFRDFPHLVALADGAEAFAGALRAAVAGEPAGRSAERIREAASHAWDVRVDRIEQILRSCARATAANRADAPAAVSA